MGLTDDKLSEKFEVAPIADDAAVVEITYGRVNPNTEEADVDLARETYRGLIDNGEAAIKDILNIASTTESARAYEVAGQLMKTVSEVAKDLLASRKVSKGEKNPNVPEKQTNIFVGSTAELMQMMKKVEDDSIEDGEVTEANE